MNTEHLTYAGFEEYDNFMVFQKKVTSNSVLVVCLFTQKIQLITCNDEYLMETKINFNEQHLNTIHKAITGQELMFSPKSKSQDTENNKRIISLEEKLDRLTSKVQQIIDKMI